MEEVKQLNAEESKERDRIAELTSRLPIPGPGRPKETEEKKLIKKAVKQLVAEYKESLADALPKISPVLIAKALTGDVSAIREVNDILVDKAPKNVDVMSGGKPIPLLYNLKDVPNNNSNGEDSAIKEEN